MYFLPCKLVFLWLMATGWVMKLIFQPVVGFEQVNALVGVVIV